MGEARGSQAGATPMDFVMVGATVVDGTGGEPVPSAALHVQDGRIAWVYHVDHVLTEAEDRAARRAIDAAYNDEPCVPFHQMVREEQRKMLQVVRDDETRAT